MLSADALHYLEDNLVGHHEIDCDQSDSVLLSMPDRTNVKSLEEFQVAPNRIKQKVALASCQSFCDYVDRFKGDGTSIYLNVDDGKFVAVLDHHEAGAPKWGSHRASFAPKQSIEWQAWAQMHRQKVTQVQLAEFIEEMLDTIIDPAPNVMLKAALEFQSNEKLTLGSTTNLNDGSVKFNFSKDNVNKSVTFPHRIKIGIPLFENEQPQELEVRIRYRTTGEGALSFTVAFVRDPRAIVRDAMRDIAANIREGTDGLAHYEGSL